MTLYWKRCNTGGIVLGMIVGTIAAVGLTLVSPNPTYPKALKAAAQKTLEGEAAKRAEITARLAAPEAVVADQAKLDMAALDKAVTKANTDLEKYANQETSFMGLEKPLIELKNPGIISIPLGFLAVILGSLLFRDKRAEDMWPEVYARQNTGILASKASAH
jgi:cation/acetate symporter